MSLISLICCSFFQWGPSHHTPGVHLAVCTHCHTTYSIWLLVICHCAYFGLLSNLNEVRGSHGFTWVNITIQPDVFYSVSWTWFKEEEDASICCYSVQCLQTIVELCFLSFFGNLLLLKAKNRGCCTLLSPMSLIVICEYGLYKYNL